MITVRRDTGIVGSAMKLDVYINDIKVARLGNGQMQTFELPSDQAELRVGFSYVKSNPVTIQDGQTAIAKGSIAGSFFWIFGLKSSYIVIEE